MLLDTLMKSSFLLSHKIMITYISCVREMIYKDAPQCSQDKNLYFMRFFRFMLLTFVLFSGMMIT